SIGCGGSIAGLTGGSIGGVGSLPSGAPLTPNTGSGSGSLGGGSGCAGSTGSTGSLADTGASLRFQLAIHSPIGSDQYQTAQAPLPNTANSTTTNSTRRPRRPTWIGCGGRSRSISESEAPRNSSLND